MSLPSWSGIVFLKLEVGLGQVIVGLRVLCGSVGLGTLSLCTRCVVAWSTPAHSSPLYGNHGGMDVSDRLTGRAGANASLRREVHVTFPGVLNSRVSCNHKTLEIRNEGASSL